VIQKFTSELMGNRSLTNLQSPTLIQKGKIKVKFGLQASGLRLLQESELTSEEREKIAVRENFLPRNGDCSLGQVVTYVEPTAKRTSRVK
jgi:hypothetical protein